MPPNGDTSLMLSSSKSFVLIFGESPPSHSHLRAQRLWHIGSQLIKECDEIKHLGILHSVDRSILSLVLDHCKAGRSAFYSLFPVAPCAGGVHPISYFLPPVFCHLFTYFIWA